MLVNVNKKNAIARGRKPGGFAALTVILWVGLELIGVAIGLSAELGLTTYLLAIVMAAIGGLTSYLIAKNCKQGDYIPPGQQFMKDMATSAESLAYPANLTIVRESSMVSALVSWNLTLNGHRIGNLENGKAMTVATNQRQNILVAVDSYGSELPPFTFDVEPGAQAQIFFKINRFLPEKSIGLRTPSAPRQAPYAVAPQNQPANTQNMSASFCHKCGATLGEGQTFCSKCGSRRFTPPPAGPQPIQQGAGYGSVSMPIRQERTPVKANPMRAVWTVAWLFVAYIIIILFQRFLSGGFMYYSGSVASLMVTAVYGASIYLYMQKGVKEKVFAACATIAAILLSIVIQLYPQILPYPLEMRANSLHFTAILNILLRAITTAGGAMLFSHLMKNKTQGQSSYGAGTHIAPSGALDKSKVWRVSFMTALVSMLANIILVVIMSFPVFKYPGFLPQFIFNNIFSALFLSFVPSGLHALSTMRSKRIRLSGWGLVWCWLCTLGMLASIVIVIVGIKSRYVIMFSSQLFMSVAALVGFIMLIAKRRVGWYIILFSVSIGLAGQFQESFRMGVILGHPNFIGAMIASIIGALNPIITWFSIQKAWNADEMPSIARPYGY